MSPVEHICFKSIRFFSPHQIVVPLNLSVPRPNSEASYLALALRSAVVCDACLHSKKARVSQIANRSEVLRLRINDERHIEGFAVRLV